MDDSTVEELAILRELLAGLLDESRRTNELLRAILLALDG